MFVLLPLLEIERRSGAGVSVSMIGVDSIPMRQKGLFSGPRLGNKIKRGFECVFNT